MAPSLWRFISAEWEFAKGLELLEGDAEIYERWSVGSRPQIGSCGSCADGTCATCSAGYKGILQDGVYPSTEFLSSSILHSETSL